MTRSVFARRRATLTFPLTASPGANLNAITATMTNTDTLWLRDGVYHQTMLVPHGRVASYPGELAILDGTGLGLGSTSHLVDVTGNGAGIVGLDIQNAGAGRGVRLLGANATATGCTVHDCGDAGIIAAGNANIIDNCEVYNVCLVNASSPHPSGGWPSAINSFGPVFNTVVRNCHVHDAWGEGIDLVEGSGQITNNTVWNTWSALVYLDGSSHVVVTGNDLFTNSATYDRNGSPAYGVLVGSEGGGPVDDITIQNNTLTRTNGIFAWNVTPTNYVTTPNTIQ